MINQGSKDLQSQLQKIYEIIDLTVFEHFGIIIQQVNDEIIVFWEGNKFKGGKQTMNSTLNSNKSGESWISNISKDKTISSCSSYDESFKESSFNDDEVLNISDFSWIPSELSEEVNDLDAIKNEVKQMYDSYEINNESDLNHDILPKDVDFFNSMLDTGESPFTTNQVYNLALIAAIKLCSRVFYSPIVEKYLDEYMNENNAFNPIQISLKIGKIKHLILNTNTLISTSYIGKDIANAFYLNVSLTFLKYRT